MTAIEKETTMMCSKDLPTLRWSLPSCAPAVIAN